MESIVDDEFIVLFYFILFLLNITLFLTIYFENVSVFHKYIVIFT